MYGVDSVIFTVDGKHYKYFLDTKVMRVRDSNGNWRKVPSPKRVLDQLTKQRKREIH